MKPMTLMLALLGSAPMVACTTGDTKDPAETTSSSSSSSSGDVSSNGGSSGMASSGGGSSNGGSSGNGSSGGGSSGMGSSGMGSSGMGSSGMGSSSSGGPGVAVIGSSLEFGDTACGATATEQSLSIENTGGTAFTFTATLGRGEESPFTLASTTGTVEPGATVQFAVAAKAIPETSAVPGNYGDTLTITTDIDGDSAHTVQLNQNARGAILALNLTSIPFGLTTVQTTKSENFQITNTGNAAAEITLVSDNAAFGTNPSGVTTVAAGLTTVAQATFSPTDTMLQTGTISIMAESGTALCAPLPAGIAVTGTGQNGGISFTNTPVDFGAVDCGTTAEAKTFTMTNSGNAPFTWSAELNREDGFYTLTTEAGPLNGTLSMGESVTFTVTTMGIPAESSVEANLYGNAITITTNVIGQSTVTVDILQTARGYVLDFDPNPVDFGNVPVNQTADAIYHVVNNGNAPANITLTSSNEAFTNTLADMVAQGNSRLEVTGTFAPGTSTDPQTAEVTLAVGETDVGCAPLPGVLNMMGTGTNGQVTYSPQTVNFGNTNCGSTAAPRTVVFTNNGNADYTITPALGRVDADAVYTMTMEPVDGIVLANGGQVTITITPTAIPAESATPGDYNDTLTVTTTVDGDEPHSIPIRQNAYGAILGAASTSSITFPQTAVNLSSTFTFSVPNTGNAPASLTFSNNNPAVFSFLNTIAAANTGANVTARFAPTAAMGYSDTANWNVATGTVLCGPLPTSRTISLTGTGSSAQPTVTVSPSTVSFGDVQCGSTATAKTITITNLQDSPIDISSATLDDGTTDNARFTVGAASRTTLGAAGSATATATITITPKMIPVAASTDVGQGAWSDRLTVTTTATAGGTLVVDLQQRAVGAIFTVSPASLGIANGRTGSFTVSNIGNAPGEFDLTLSGSNDFSFSPPENSGMTQPNASRTNSIEYQRPLFGGDNTAQVAITAPQTTVLCRPLPGAVMLTGG